MTPDAKPRATSLYVIPPTFKDRASVRAFVAGDEYEAISSVASDWISSEGFGASSRPDAPKADRELERLARHGSWSLLDDLRKLGQEALRPDEEPLVLARQRWSDDSQTVESLLALIGVHVATGGDTDGIELVARLARGLLEELRGAAAA